MEIPLLNESEWEQVVACGTSVHEMKTARVEQRALDRCFEQDAVYGDCLFLLVKKDCLESDPERTTSLTPTTIVLAVIARRTNAGSEIDQIATFVDCRSRALDAVFGTRSITAAFNG
ncbi:hypothetical protein [Hyphomicrobium sp.]|uniref:hypothetical protein n=1 Tax=Hyphomicrobium sp. TaxID=82 RepID=UPI000F99FEE1|nr:hypothetical protein [Hyphomicrobium sp.]RUP07532.1 MAG: hypothetical protein EKK38_18290 [Hyphomicrobium sp.]